MFIAGYEKWRADTILSLQAENPVLQCPFCHDNFWPGCDECDFEGEFNALDAPEVVIESLLSRFSYQSQVIADLKKWCAYTGQDFLMAVGPFVQGFREKPLCENAKD